MDGLVIGMENAARRAGEIVLSARGRDLHAQNKEGRFNFVTEYDGRVQSFLFGALAKLLPDARFLGEEAGRDAFRPGDESGWLFVVDPIDGTTNFMHDLHPFVVSIGLLRDGAPYAGVVFAPVTGQMFSACRGRGAYENGRPIRSSSAPLSDGVVIAGTSPYSLKAMEISRGLTRDFQVLCPGVRNFGSAEYSLCMVASGRASVYCELTLSLWDYAAGGVLVEEAGGKMRSWSGGPLSYRGSSSVLALSEGAAGDSLLPDPAPYARMWDEAGQR